MAVATLDVKSYTVGRINVFELPSQSDLAFFRWGRMLDETFRQVRDETQVNPDLRTYIVLHDLRVFESPTFEAVNNIRAGLRMHGHLGIPVRCAVLLRDAVTVKLLRRLLNLPAYDEVDTLQINSDSQVWSEDSTVGYFDNYDAAVDWLNGRRP